MTVATEENSYGLVGGKWFDGYVRCFPVFSGDAIKIVQVFEYHNLKSDCSNSYYECLAERFASMDFKEFFGTTNKRCRHQTKCTPYSLPFNGKDIPLCRNEFDRACSAKALAHLKIDQKNHCKRSCHVEEYKTKSVRGGLREQSGIDKMNETAWHIWLNENWNWTDGQEPRRSFVMEYNFELPSITRDHRSEEPFKTVRTEYLIMTWMLLVGNVGRTWGMFVGFSLFGIFEFIAEAVTLLYASKKARIVLKANVQLA